jgi:hypothetical protein
MQLGWLQQVLTTGAFPADGILLVTALHHDPESPVSRITVSDGVYSHEAVIKDLPVPYLAKSVPVTCSGTVGRGVAFLSTRGLTGRTLQHDTPTFAITTDLKENLKAALASTGATMALLDSSRRPAARDAFEQPPPRPPTPRAVPPMRVAPRGRVPHENPPLHDPPPSPRHFSFLSPSTDDEIVEFLSSHDPVELSELLAECEANESAGIDLVAVEVAPVATHLPTAFTPARATVLFADVPNVSMTVSLHVLVLAIDRLPTKCGPDRMRRVACQDSAGVCGFVSAYSQETVRMADKLVPNVCYVMG